MNIRNINIENPDEFLVFGKKTWDLFSHHTSLYQFRRGFAMAQLEIENRDSTAAARKLGSLGG